MGIICGRKAHKMGKREENWEGAKGLGFVVEKENPGEAVVIDQRRDSIGA